MSDNALNNTINACLLWIFADKRQIPQLEVDALYLLHSCLGKHPSRSTKREIVDDIYANTLTDSPLRVMIVTANHMFNPPAKATRATLDVLPKDFLIDLLLAENSKRTPGSGLVSKLQESPLSKLDRATLDVSPRENLIQTLLAGNPNRTSGSWLRNRVRDWGLLESVLCHQGCSKGDRVCRSLEGNEGTKRERKAPNDFEGLSCFDKDLFDPDLALA